MTADVVDEVVVEVLAAADCVFEVAEGFDDGEGVLLDELFAAALCARKATNRFAKNGLLVGMALSGRLVSPPFPAAVNFFFLFNQDPQATLLLALLFHASSSWCFLFDCGKGLVLLLAQR